MTDTPEDLPQDDELPEVAEVEAPSEEHLAAEAEAIKYGWKPKDQFTLAPDGWVDASKFLTMPSTQLKISRDVQRELKREIEDAKARAERAERMSTTVADKVREQERAKYEADLVAIRQQQRSAVEIGDVASFDALEQRRVAMAPPAPVVTPAPQASVPPPEIKAYFDANPWTSDIEMWTVGATAVQQAISGMPPGASLSNKTQLRIAEDAVRRIFPENFQAAAPKAPSKVDGGGSGGISNRQGFAQRLPADVAKAGADFVKQGIFKNLEDYAREYFEG